MIAVNQLIYGPTCRIRAHSPGALLTLSTVCLQHESSAAADRMRLSGSHVHQIFCAFIFLRSAHYLSRVNFCILRSSFLDIAASSYIIKIMCLAPFLRGYASSSVIRQDRFCSSPQSGLAIVTSKLNEL